MSQYKEEVNKYLIAFQEGDASQFAEFYQRKRSTLGLHAMRILFNKQNWEDVLSVAYLKISTSIAGFNRFQDGYNWILKIIENTAKTYNSKEAKYCAIELDNVYIDKGFDPYAEIDVSIDLDLALQGLDPKSIMIATLYFRAGRTQEEIGKMLGITKSAVNHRLKKTRNFLKNKNII